MFVITGGGSGIGEALAYALAARKQSVFIIGRRENLLLQVAESSPYIQYIVADISTADGRLKVAQSVGSMPKILGLIHNAGIIEPIAPILEIKESAWRQVFATNVEAPLFLTQLLHKQLERVMHIGSGAAHFPVMGWSAYCASKAALSMVNQCWQLESNGVAFTSVMPGIIDTPMQAAIRGAQNMDAQKLEFFIRLKQQQKLIQPQTVALFLSWLLLDTDTTQYESQEWDIYDTTHHAAWLIAPHMVPKLEP